MGSPTALSLPLTRSFCYQFAVCLIVRESFDVKLVDVFDPIMDANDTEACRSLLSEFRPEIPSIDDICDCTYPIEEDECKSDDDVPRLLLWMPHCEASLYKTVLVAIEAGEDPLAAAKTLAGDDHREPRIRYELSNVVLVGNSLTKYMDDMKLPRHIVDRAVLDCLQTSNIVPLDVRNFHHSLTQRRWIACGNGGVKVFLGDSHRIEDGSIDSVFLKVDGTHLFPDTSKSSFGTELCKISTDKPMGICCKFFQFDFWCQLHISRMDFQDLKSSGVIRYTNINFLVEPAKSPKGGINRVLPVSGCNNHDLPSSLESVHKCKQL
ncbi:DNA-dependent ATPase, putative [Babesia ovis]|uniref:DNA-dependent ATPase, putative n=1 Tax=Babesia ovis TaxID=5869 RepID=A0A9W5T9S7_BABOV|nr:DNA-dependent ATPase, putative [Babesia ovis]